MYCQRQLGDTSGKNGAGPPVFNHQFICVTNSKGKLVCDSTNNPKNNKLFVFPAQGEPSKPENDNPENSTCEVIDDDKDKCFESCVINK